MGQFWIRRARRLLPALLTMLARRGHVGVAVRLGRAAVAAAARPAVGSRLPGQLGADHRQRAVLLVVVATAAAPSVVARRRGAVVPAVAAGLRRARRARMVAAPGEPLCSPARSSSSGQAWPSWAPDPSLRRCVSRSSAQVDRTNLLYLSSLTRAGGLLLGAAAAFVWRPWRIGRRGRRRQLTGLECVGRRGAHRGGPRVLLGAPGDVGHVRLDAAAGVDRLARGGLRRRAPCCTDPAARARGRPPRRRRQAQLRHLPVALADLRAVRRRGRRRVARRAGGGAHRARQRAVLPLRRDADPDGHVAHDAVRRPGRSAALADGHRCTHGAARAVGRGARRPLRRRPPVRPRRRRAPRPPWPPRRLPRPRPPHPRPPAQCR